MADNEENVVTLSAAITVAPDIANPDSIIEAVRGIRVRTLNVQLAHGCQGEGDGFEAMHKNLQELEKSAVQEKRLKLDETKANDDGLLARTIAREMLAMSGKTRILESSGGVIPDPSALIEDIEDGSGVLTIGDDARKYDDFMAGAGADIKERVRSGELLLNEI